VSAPLSTYIGWANGLDRRTATTTTREVPMATEGMTCVECGDALDGNTLHGVCSACIADGTEVGDERSREQVALDIAAYDRTVARYYSDAAYRESMPWSEQPS